MKRELEGGWFQWVELPLPALLTIQSGINQLRYATLKGIMAAKKKEIRKVPAPAGVGARQRIVALYVPEKAKKTQMIGGSAAEAAKTARARRCAKMRGSSDAEDSGDCRTARRHVEPRVVGSDRRRAAARRRRPPSIVAGREVGAVAAELAAADVAEVIALQHAALEPYTPTATCWRSPRHPCRRGSDLVFLPHTYQTRDFAPALAARLDRALVTDCTAFKPRTARLAFTRPMFQGKLTADVGCRRRRAAPRHVPDRRVSRGRAEAGRAAAPRSRRSRRRSIAAGIRQKPEAPFKEAKQAVDLSQAERIVAVGRGIKAQEHLRWRRSSPGALGAEIAASRPICDAGWLPMDRQIGSSGQTVAPKLYVALGISGAIQHLVGMKGSRTIVAINKDAEAPIFEVADYGIVGDLFEIVPAMIAELEK